MKIFIDTADIDEIRDAAAMGVIDGVTTNPSLVAKTGRPFKEVLVDIYEVVDGPISAEVDRDRLRRYLEGGARARVDAQEHRGQGSRSSPRGSRRFAR